MYIGCFKNFLSVPVKQHHVEALRNINCHYPEYIIFAIAIGRKTIGYIIAKAFGIGLQGYLRGSRTAIVVGAGNQVLCSILYYSYWVTDGRV